MMKLFTSALRRHHGRRHESYDVTFNNGIAILERHARMVTVSLIIIETEIASRITGCRMTRLLVLMPLLGPALLAVTLRIIGTLFTSLLSARDVTHGETLLFTHWLSGHVITLLADVCLRYSGIESLLVYATEAIRFEYRVRVKNTVYNTTRQFTLEIVIASFGHSGITHTSQVMLAEHCCHAT